MTITYSVAAGYDEQVIIDAVVDALAVDLGDFSAQSNLKSLLAVLGGGWNTDDKTLYAKLITDLLGHGTHGLAALAAQTDVKDIGRPQVFVKSVTSAANAAADTTLATVTAQGVEIDYIIVHADAAQHADMTSAAVKGGAAKVLTFIAAADLLQADLDAENKQVAWNTGRVYLPVGGTIVMEHTGTNTGALDLTVIIGYHSVADGGYLA